MRLLIVLALLLCAVPAAAQIPILPDAYQDERARELVQLARARRAVIDTRITAYETTARERMSARMAVAGVERLIFRRETASRIAWTPDTVRIELLGAREAQPLISRGLQLPPPDLAGMLPALAFDPVDAEMLLRVDTTVIRHPLAPGSEAYYRFAGGDSTTIRIPNGQQVRLRELRVTARRADPQLINGSFWVDAETHAVVRAAFRLSRGISATKSSVSVLTPEVTGEVDHVAIDYGLWDMRWWLPRSVVARGVIRVMGARFPLAYERSYHNYRVEGDMLAVVPPTEAASVDQAQRPCRPRAFGSVTINVGGPSDTAVRDSVWSEAWARSAARLVAADTARNDGRPPCDRAFIVTRAEGTDLVTSPVFASGIYDEGAGPVSEEELRALAGLLRAIPTNPWSVGRPTVQLLTPELVRANRVEGLSLGGRVALPLGPAELRGELRAGTTGELGARLSGLYSASTLRSELAFFRGLEAVEVAAQPFSLTSTVSALLLGRDENDYFRGTGAELRLSPSLSRRQNWDTRLFVERQEPVRTRSTFSVRGLLDDGFEPRENLAAEPLDQAGATLRLRAARGDDPARLRTRAELELHGETGERTFARPILRLGADLPLGGGLGLGMALAAGTSAGDVPLQRSWQIGGAATVRGHDPAALRGESLWLARSELGWGSPAVRLGVFGDAGWAGEQGELWSARPLKGAGVGVSLLDNLLRVEMARGIDGGGYRVHLRMGRPL